jgi:hypothetical protein
MAPSSRLPILTCHSDQPARTEATRPLAGFLLTVCLATICLVLVFYEGLRRGMDHVTMFGPENEQAAIAIALSDLVYNLNEGYVGYASVFQRLVEVWNRGAKSGHDPILIENGSDRQLLNDAINAAASLGPQPTAFVGDRSLMTMIYTDLGQVDLNKLAFGIFGFKIESRYYMFFLLLSASAGLYLLVFWRSLLPGIVLLCTLFSFYIELHTSVFTFHMPTFSSERHGSTLALIPLWHFTFLLIYRYRASATTVVATLCQLAIMLLAIKIRGSATWVIIFVATVSFVLAFFCWRRLLSEERTWARLLRITLRWPLVLLVGGVFVHNEYVKTTLHPVYFTDDVMPYHGLWASAFAGMVLMAPELMPENSKTPEIARAGSLGIDTAIHAAALEYLNDTQFLRLPPDYPRSAHPSFISPWTGTYKTRLMDDIMRRIVIRIALRHPLAMPKLYFYEKPLATFRELRKVIIDSPNLNWLWLLILGGLSSFVLIFTAGGVLDDFQLRKTSFLVGAAIPFASLPTIWAWPESYSTTDLLLVMVVFVQLLICTAATFFIRHLPLRWRMFPLVTFH